MSRKGILSIDVGISNFAWVYIILDEENKEEIVDFDCVDITMYEHKQVPLSQCKLYHTRSITDCMEHLYQECPHFDSSFKILVERQPFSGIKAVEESILQRYRSKTILVAPRSMHSHFGIGRLTYDERKKETQKIAIPLLEQDKLSTFSRIADICDALCIFLYWKTTIDQSFFSLDQFKYNPNKLLKFAFKRDIKR